MAGYRGLQGRGAKMSISAAILCTSSGRSTYWSRCTPVGTRRLPTQASSFTNFLFTLMINVTWA